LKPLVSVGDLPVPTNVMCSFFASSGSRVRRITIAWNRRSSTTYARGSIAPA
jgi:hypothetical protein